MSAITEWRQREVIGEIGDELEGNMEIANRVVLEDARRNLLKVGDPEWGRGYRQMLALYRLTSFVERDKRSITGRVGMPGGKAGYDGFYIETGSRTASAHPWLRPALLHNLRDITTLLAGG